MIVRDAELPGDNKKFPFNHHLFLLRENSNIVIVNVCFAISDCFIERFQYTKINKPVNEFGCTCPGEFHCIHYC